MSNSEAEADDGTPWWEVATLSRSRSISAGWARILDQSAPIQQEGRTNPIDEERAASGWEAEARQKGVAMIEAEAQQKRSMAVAEAANEAAADAADLSSDPSPSPLSPSTTGLHRRGVSTRSLKDDAISVTAVEREKTELVQQRAEAEQSQSSSYSELRAHPPRVISSYLDKLGQARGKWSQRYFTLLPTHARLIYSHKKIDPKQTDSPSSPVDQHHDHDHEHKAARGEILVGHAGVRLHPRSRGSPRSAPPLAARHRSVPSFIRRLSFITASSVSNDSDDAHSPPFPHLPDDDDAELDIEEISLHRFRLETDDSAHFTIIVPAETSTSGDVRSYMSNGANANSKERRIQLRAANKQLLDAWLTELRRLQFTSLYLESYTAIRSRNRVYAMQGKHHLIQDPNPAGVPIPAHLRTNATDDMGIDGPSTMMPSASAMSLFTSALTGRSSSSNCARCGSSFGLLTKKLKCMDCGLMFCNRNNCTVTVGLTTVPNSDDSFSSLTSVPLTDEHSSPQQRDSRRLCVECDRARAHDPVFQHLLHGHLNLCIKIIAGRDLLACDIGGTSDPYVKFTAQDREYRTPVIPATLNPVWDGENTAEFNIPWGEDMSHEHDDDESNMDDRHMLCLEMYDHDLLNADAFMGCVYVPVRDLPKNCILQDWFPLRPKRDPISAQAAAAAAAAAQSGDAAPTNTNANRMRVTGAIRLQLILTTSSYMADLLRIRTSVNGLARRPAFVHPIQSIQITPPKLGRWASMRSMRTLATGNDDEQSVARKPTPTPPDPSSPVAQLSTQLRQFLSSSQLHPLLIRFMSIISSFELSWYATTWQDIMTYRDPFFSISAFIVYMLAVIYVPARAILPLISFILLLLLLSDAITRTVEEGEQCAARMAALQKARTRAMLNKKEESDKQSEQRTDGTSAPTPTSNAQPRSRRSRWKSFFGSKKDTDAEDSKSTSMTSHLRKPSASSLARPSRSPSRSQSRSDVFLRPPHALQKGMMTSIPDDDNGMDDGVEELPDESELGDDEERESTASVVVRMRKLQRQALMVQQTLDGIADMCEEALKIWYWEDVGKSQRFARALIALFLLTVSFSPRFLLIVFGAHKWSRHLFKIRRRIRALRLEQSVPRPSSHVGHTIAGGWS